ncbi:uncharacterized protein [Paramormyrops kingsleyae]|uniref:uncharacterized protein n=1 Tax=Paramormyrops kingsleyae TaxID=1676925 RepID=UPI003B971E64
MALTGCPWWAKGLFGGLFFLMVILILQFVDDGEIKEEKRWNPEGVHLTRMKGDDEHPFLRNYCTSNRHFLLCPVCKKTQASLSVHLTRVCMKRSSKEAIQEVVEKAKQDVLEVLQWGRVFSYRHLRDIMDDANPMSRMIQELERRHMVVPDTPSPAVAAQTSSVPVMAGTTVQRPESSATEQSEDAVSVSNGEIFQVTLRQTAAHRVPGRRLDQEPRLEK